MFHHRRPLISLEYVSKSYGDDFLDFENFVLRNLSLTIQQGEFVIIFGPSGSGKSTLLNLIAGLEFPSAGKVKIGKQNLARLSEDRLAKFHRLKMGMVFQNFNLIKSLNVWENVALPQTAEGIPYAERYQRAKELLNLFGLEPYMHRHPNELSGGEQQRVAIARALVNNPLLLLVDEPTGNLDSDSAGDVMKLLHGLHYRSQHTILLVTHNPDYLSYASRVIYLEDGTIKKQEWHEQKTQTAVPAVLPDEHYVKLGQYRQVEKYGDSLAPLEAMYRDHPIGSPARPAGVGAAALSINQSTPPHDGPAKDEPVDPYTVITSTGGAALFGDKEHR